jgi:hypothetical protein
MTLPPPESPKLHLEPFHGVDPEALYAIGCITTAAGEVEWLAREMLRNLYLDPGNEQLSNVLKLIRKQVSGGAMPSHARVAGDEIVEWTHGVRTVLGERHAVSHSLPMKRAGQSTDGPLTLEAVNMHLRTRMLLPLEAERLLSTALKIAGMGTIGGRLCRALMHNPRRGVHLPNTVLQGEWFPTCTVADGFVLIRPTTAEMADWQRAFGPIPELAGPPMLS